MAGRPRALDEVKRREVCALVSTGCGIVAAARYVGCNAITVRREAMRNPAFYEQLRGAELAAQITPLQAVRKAAGTHWRAAAWFLERTQPDQFARRNPLAFTPEQVEQFVARLGDVIRDEVCDPDTRGRIQSGLGAVWADCARQARAADTPRRDVHSRRKSRELRVQSREPEVESWGIASAPVNPSSSAEVSETEGRAESAPEALPASSIAQATATDTIEQNAMPLCAP